MVGRLELVGRLEGCTWKDELGRGSKPMDWLVGQPGLQKAHVVVSFCVLRADLQGTPAEGQGCLGGGA